MDVFNFVMDSNSFVDIFESGVTYTDLFEVVSEAFSTRGTQTGFWVGDYVFQDIPRAFRDVKKELKESISKGLIQVEKVDRKSKHWKSLAERALTGNGFNSFINSGKDPYDIDCAYLQEKLETDRGETVIITTDSGLEAFTWALDRHSLDLVGLCCMTRSLLGHHDKLGLLTKLENSSSVKQKSFIKGQERMQVLADRRDRALKFIPYVFSRLNPRRGKKRILPQRKRTLRAAAFKFVVQAADCQEYNPIVSQEVPDCFLCFNQRIAHICPNLETF